MLGDVGEKFCDAVVGEGLHRRVEKTVGLECGIDRHGNRQRRAGREGFDRHSEAGIKCRRVNAADDFTQFGESLFCGRVRGVNQSRRLIQIGASREMDACLAQLHGNRHEPRLRAVVEVALNSTQPRVGVGDRCRARGPQSRNPLARPCGAKQRASQHPIQQRKGVHNPGPHEQQAQSQRVLAS